MRYVVCGADGQLAGRVAENALVYAPAGSKFTFFAWTSSPGIPKVIEGDFSKAPVPFCAMDGYTNELAVKTGLMNVPSHAVEELTGRKAKSAAEVAPLYKAMWAADVDNWLKIK